MGVAERLAEAGFVLPEPPAAIGSYVPAVLSGGFVFTSGQLPFSSGELLATGRVGASVDESAAFSCASRCALNALAAASGVCSLEDVVRVVKLTGYVASAPGFNRQPAVIDGASAIMTAAFGPERGAHAREAVGVAELPLEAPVEVSIILEVAHE